MVDKYEALDRLSKLKADGVLNDAEFAAEKARVLAGNYEHHDRQNGTQASDTKKWRWGSAALVGAAIGGVVAISQIDWAPGGATLAHDSTAGRIAFCNSPVVREALTNAFEHSAADRLANIKVLDIGDVVQRSYDDKKPERVCAADVTLNTGREHTGFRVYPTSDGANIIVETMDDPGPAPIPVASENSISAAPSPIPAEEPLIAPAPAGSPEPETRELWRLDNPSEAEAAKLAAVYPSREAAVDALGSPCGVAATGPSDEESGWKYNGALCDDDSIR